MTHSLCSDMQLLKACGCFKLCSGAILIFGAAIPHLCGHGFSVLLIIGFAHHFQGAEMPDKEGVEQLLKDLQVLDL